MSKMKEHLKQVKNYLKEEYFGIPNTTEKSNLSEKVKNKDLQNVLDGFQSDHIVMASIGHIVIVMKYLKYMKLLVIMIKRIKKLLILKQGKCMKYCQLKITNMFVM